MSRKEVVVSNVSKEHDNPIAELVQVACRYDSEIILESNNRRINAKLEKEGINISVSALIAGGETPKNILSNTMKDARILDLTGCSVEEVLYYVSCGNPVFAMTGSNEAVLVVGYDANNVIIFDSSSGNNFKQSITEADEVFKGAGNVFFTYLK